jgi:hypothetical protein
MRNTVAAAAMTAGLAACAATGDAPVAGLEPASMTCNAAAALGHLGHDATEAMGQAILKDSGASILRWGPPNSVWTMDYREDRVNVRYDDKMKITEITCG